jgi:hypothetical protein
MFREICAFQVRVLGKDHPDTRKTMDNFIACIRSAPDGKDLTSEQMALVMFVASINGISVGFP